MKTDNFLHVTLKDGTLIKLSKFMDFTEVLKMIITSAKYLHHINACQSVNHQKFDKVIYLKEGCTYFYKGLQYFSNEFFSTNSLFMFDHFIKVKSYVKDFQFSLSIVEESIGSINGKNILLIDDIFDTGNTIRWIKEYLYSLGAKNIYTYCFFTREKNSMDINSYSIFIDNDNFLVGCGLDYDNEFRELGALYFIESIENK